MPEEFEVQIEEGLTEAQAQESIREQIENTIRWRRVLEDGYEVFLESMWVNRCTVPYSLSFTDHAVQRTSS